MKKGQLKALFIEAKGTGQKYIGVMIQTEGSSEPEVIINPKENFNAKFDYYMAAYDDDLILIFGYPGPCLLSLHRACHVFLRDVPG